MTYHVVMASLISRCVYAAVDFAPGKGIVGFNCAGLEVL